jgi:hypothetical protein
MPHFRLKKLPPGWLFVPSKRQLRAVLAETGADVPLVEMAGTGYARLPDRVSLGFLESRVVEGRWRFYLHLWGIREAAVGTLREELATAALAEIREYIRGCISQQPADIIKPAQLRLSFRISPAGVHFEGRVKVVGRYSYPTPVWWPRETPE